MGYLIHTKNVSVKVSLKTFILNMAIVAGNQNDSIQEIKNYEENFFRNSKLFK